MGLNYDKSKKHADDSPWGSYSDLFMVLSFVFLLMYVVSSLKDSAHSIQKMMEVKKVTRQNDDLKQQIKVYDSLKEQYLAKQASQEEQETYNDLMDKLSLLKEKTVKDRQNLRDEISKNEEKEQALNKYQQIIRNIINANMVAKGRIQRRNRIIESKQEDLLKKEEVIAFKNEQIEQNKLEISDLRENISDKENSIKENNEKIALTEQKMREKIKSIEKLHLLNKTTKEQMETELKKVQVQAAQKVAQIEAKNKEVTSQMNFELQKLSEKLVQTRSAIEAVSQEKDQLENKFQDKVSENQQLEEAKAEVEKANQLLAQKSAKLDKEAKNLSGQVDKLSSSNEKLQQDLARAQELLGAKKKIVQKIKENLKGSGVDAQVNEETGEVILGFGDEYFDTGKHGLKPKMEEILEKFMPLYAKGIFADKEAAKNISSVEVIGFASPTYQGKLIDPKSLDPKDRAAVSYNLDLSYYRAKAIFKHVFNTDKMKFDKQKSLLPLVKVSGRSFLASEIKGRGVASGMSQEDYCKTYNCHKSQKVIIKFDLE